MDRDVVQSTLGAEKNHTGAVVTEYVILDSQRLVVSDVGLCLYVFCGGRETEKAD